MLTVGNGVTLLKMLKQLCYSSMVQIASNLVLVIKVIKSKAVRKKGVKKSNTVNV
jgi:hypothetical protein